MRQRMADVVLKFPVCC